MIHLNSLSATSISSITECFNEAFRDYFVPFHATEAYLQDRWQAAGVDYGLSVGAFDEEKLVGFMILCTGETGGIPTIHNAGTGVLSAYRGRRLIVAMYDHVLPKLIAAGFRQSTLEVITLNEKAIRAYERAGYQKVRTLHCFAGTIRDASLPAAPEELRKETHLDWSLLRTLPPHLATWEQRPVVLAARAELYECWQWWTAGRLRAYAIFNPQTGQLSSFSAETGGALRYGLPLLGAIGNSLSRLSINNVDARDSEWLLVFEALGLENPVDQYEMKWQW